MTVRAVQSFSSLKIRFKSSLQIKFSLFVLQPKFSERGTALATRWIITSCSLTAGVSEEVLALADGCALVPMLGFVDSYNVSVAAALTLYEVWRCTENFSCLFSWLN